MHPLAELESSAHRLQNCLISTSRVDLHLLCGLCFFEKNHSFPKHILEPYVRQFSHKLAEAANQCNPSELLPEDISRLRRLADYLSTEQSQVAGNLESFGSLISRYEALTHHEPPFSESGKGYEILIPCLFVEQNPDLGIGDRGRILNLRVRATAIPHKVAADEALVLHDHAKADPEFQNQASKSLKAARKYLTEHYRIPTKNRYRVEFWFEDPAPRLAGESLGVAFAVGAVVAISRLDVDTVRLSIPSGTAFTGALSADGVIKMIDGEGLRLKIHRATHSHLAAVAVPDKHMVEAVQHRQGELATAPNKVFQVVGANTLESVMSNRLLIFQKSYRIWEAVARKAWRVKQSLWVEIPALAVLISILAWIIIVPLDNTPYEVRFLDDGFEVVNRFDWQLWDKTFPGATLDTAPSMASYRSDIADLNGDNSPEVLVLISSKRPDSLNARLYVYNSQGDTIFTRWCGIAKKYPTDTIPEGQPDFYEANRVKVISVNGQTHIITELAKQEPSRGYIRIWSNDGDSIGWYINSGGVRMRHVADADHDGSDDLVFFGFNNRLSCVALFVLPADSLHGVGPPYDTNSNGYDLSYVERGNHIAYLAFPPTDVWQKTGRQAYQGDIDIECKNDEIVAAVHEWLGPNNDYRMVRYHITPDFRIANVTLDDPFRTIRQRLIADSIVADIPESTYCNRLRDNVIRYLPK
jgi:hypothetical protein